MNTRGCTPEAKEDIVGVTPMDASPDGQTSPDRTFAICIFANEKTLKPKRRNSLTLLQIMELNKSREFRSSKSGRMMGAYQLDGPRCDKNVKYRSLIQLDVDTEGVKDKKTGRIIEVTKTAPELEDLQGKISEFEWFANSSHWHEPSMGVRKYRITIVPDRDILPDEYKPLLEAVDERLGGVLDRGAWALSQAFYLPSCPVENKDQAFFFHNAGAPLNVDEFVRRGREIIAGHQPSKTKSLATTNSNSPSEIPENVDYVASLLNAISAYASYAEWRNVVWALASLGWKSGEVIAREWSKSAPEKYDELAFNSVWGSYDSQREGRIGFGTLEYMARKRGANVTRPKLSFSGLGADIFNGKKFAEMFRGKLLHVHETNQWLQFDPQQGWILAPPGEAERAAKSVVAKLWNELSDEMGKKL